MLKLKIDGVDHELDMSIELPGKSLMEWEKVTDVTYGEVWDLLRRGAYSGLLFIAFWALRQSGDLTPLRRLEPTDIDIDWASQSADDVADEHEDDLPDPT